jgi:kumamolisin
MNSRYIALAGSERQVAPGAQRIGPADPAERLEVTLYLRARVSPPAGPPGQPLTRAEFAAKAGAQPADIDALRVFAHATGLRMVRISLAERIVVLSGTVEACSRAFNVELGRYEGGGITYRGREGSIHLPEALAGAVVAVLGLDDRPAAERR